MTSTEQPTRGSVSAAVSNAVVHLLTEHTGRGPTKARTIIDRDSVTVILADTLTKGERKLVDHGQRDLVLDVRHTFQTTMESDLVDAVEKLTGRKVAAFMSSNHIAPDIAAEIFVLEPVAGAQNGQPA